MDNHKIGDKTTVRENREGVITRKLTLSKFDYEIHKNIKERAYGDVTVEDIYSEAISMLRRDCDLGHDIAIMDAPKAGRRVQVWLTDEADADMQYLSNKFQCEYKAVVFTAMVRYLENDNKKIAPGLP